MDPYTSGVERLPPPADFINRCVVAVHLRFELGAVFGKGVLDFFVSRTIFLFELGNREASSSARLLLPRPPKPQPPPQLARLPRLWPERAPPHQPVRLPRVG